ncbi:APC family permease [Rhodococcus sp. NPDC056960]|uniref:APC family permease n=1 Tax=Rhodococcus sp. NPDC056960 TaxID=3345982 RepID=UPI00362A5023
MVDTSSSGPDGRGAVTDSPHLEGGHLGRGPLVSLSLASFIPAVGMALLPILMLSAAGPTAFMSALLTAVLVSCVGVSVITFARRYVTSGSLYSYIGEVFGSWARYLTAAALLVGYITQVAAIAGTVGIFSGSFLASRGMTGVLGVGVQSVIIIGAVTVAGAVAYRGLDTSVRVAVTLAVLSIPLMLVITVASAAHTGLALGTQFDFDAATPSGVLLGVAAGAAWLIGFESCTSMAAETKDPRRNVPWAVMSVPVVLGALYVLCTILQVPGLLAVSDQIADGVSAPAALALGAGLGTGVAEATDLVLAVACFAALIGFVNYGARCVMAVAEDGLLPPAAAAVHPRFHSPHRATVLMCVLGAAVMTVLIFLSGSITSAYTMVAALIAYAWCAPYVLISIGAVVLTVRLGERKPSVVIASVVGGAGIAWTYVTGWITPPAPPADSMRWFVLVALAAALLVVVASSRRNRTRSGAAASDEAAVVSRSR